MNIVYYRRRGCAVSFAYNGIVHTFYYYSTRDAYRLFKQKIGINRAHLERDDAPITYGFLY